VLADARPPALLAQAFLAVVRALCAPLLHSASSSPRPALSLPTLCLPCRARSLGQRTLSLLLHSLSFSLVLNPFLLVFGHFLPLVFELLASRPTSLTARPLFCRLAPPSIACLLPAVLPFVATPCPPPSFSLPLQRASLYCAVKVESKFFFLDACLLCDLLPFKSFYGPSY
jgi:hypothetical protein